MAGLPCGSLLAGGQGDGVPVAPRRGTGLLWNCCTGTSATGASWRILFATQSETSPSPGVPGANRSNICMPELQRTAAGPDTGDLAGLLGDEGVHGAGDEERGTEDRQGGDAVEQRTDLPEIGSSGPVALAADSARLTPGSFRA